LILLAFHFSLLWEAGGDAGFAGFVQGFSTTNPALFCEHFQLVDLLCRVCRVF
jgi:hypothetical protein